ncbi:hypothetical protein [Kitasatospora camelliae]|uniref:C2H2-type domain-containing protein n=1 Tax=Kitasatospora camelliae TaxID=3156397 RepID=A0AAU8K655_9ACTN
MTLTCPGSYADEDAMRAIPCQERHHPEGLHHAHHGTRCIMWVADAAAAINSVSACPQPPAHEVEKPAPGPCPIDDCDWDAEGTLDDHLFTQHDEEELSKTLVRFVLESDRLKAQLAEATADREEQLLDAYASGWADCINLGPSAAPAEG